MEFRDALMLREFENLCHAFLFPTSALDVGRWTFSSSIADCLYPLPSDSLDELRIGQTCLTGCEREVFVVCQNGIRVRLNEVELVLRREA